VRRVFPVVLFLVAVAWPAVARAQAREPIVPRDQIVLSGDVLVPRGHVVGEVVVFHGTATIQGVVDGDVVVIDGPIVVSGQVSGSVVAVDGRVVLQKTAQVVGDVLAGGDVQRSAGASVDGQVREGVRFSLSGGLAALGALLASIAIAGSLLVLLGLFMLLAPRGAERVADAVWTAPIVSGAWGLGLLVLLPTTAALLVATILGLPLGLAIVLGLGLFWLFGLAAITWGLGRLLVRAPGSRAGALFAGWAISSAVGLVPGLNAVWWTLGSAYGLGAILVATWRARHEPVAPAPRPDTRPAKGGKHRAGRIAPAPVGTGFPETPLGED
jgi:hypothetical protein